MSVVGFVGHALEVVFFSPRELVRILAFPVNGGLLARFVSLDCPLAWEGKSFLLHIGSFIGGLGR